MNMRYSLASVWKGMHGYRYITRERYRIDWLTLAECSLYEELNFKELCMRWLLKHCHWIKSTHHFIHERLTDYVNRPSRDGSYVEVLPQERDILLTIDEMWVKKVMETCGMIVEVGLNVRKQICKIALVVPLHVVHPEIYHETSIERYLFLCLGLDGGIKTMYITPVFKDREAYCSAPGIDYVDMHWLLSHNS